MQICCWSTADTHTQSTSAAGYSCKTVKPGDMQISSGGYFTQSGSLLTSLGCFFSFTSCSFCRFVLLFEGPWGVMQGHTHTHTHAHAHTHTRSSVHTHTHAHTHTHTHTRSSVRTHARTHAHTHTHTLYCAHTHTHGAWLRAKADGWSRSSGCQNVR